MVRLWDARQKVSVSVRLDTRVLEWLRLATQSNPALAELGRTPYLFVKY